MVGILIWGEMMAHYCQKIYSLGCYHIVLVSKIWFYGYQNINYDSCNIVLV